MTELGGVHVGWDVMKLSFAFDAARFPVVLDAMTTRGPDTAGDEPAWAVGIAHGDVRRVKEAGSALTESGLLWWGPPIVAASALAGLARPGEILCAQTVPALRAGELATSGVRIAREGTLRVRGARIDRRQPWRRMAAENLTRMTTPKLVRESLLRVITIEPGALVVVRADPGAGGTRLLDELASHQAFGSERVLGKAVAFERVLEKALVISPVGSGFEPLGALRRALGRSIGRELNPMLLELAAPLETLLAGRGVSLDMASRLITAFLWPKQSGSNGVLLIDDAKAVDPATLEACVRAVQHSPSFGMVVRLDATSGLPSVLATLSKSAEHEIPPLSPEGAEDVALGCTGGALDALARRRWARLGGGSPLAIVEAVTLGIATGDITWSDGRASPRSRAAGRGKVTAAAEWIRQRANAESTPARAVLSLLAVVGGEARIGFLSRVLDRAGVRIDVLGTIAQLERSRWIVAQEPLSAGDVSPGGERSVAFPSRTHHKALFHTLEDDVRKKLHLAIAREIEEEEGVFGRVEGAWHAAQAGEAAHASAALLEGARVAADARFEASCTQLIAFARRADPSCEEAALELLANALERAPSRQPPSMSMPPATSASVAPPAATWPPPWALPLATAHASIPPPRPSVAPATSPSRVDAEADSPNSEEPDSMIEHARIVLPDHVESPIGGASAPPGSGAADSEPPTMMNEGLAPMAADDGRVPIPASEPPESTLESAAGPIHVRSSAGFVSSPPDSSVPGSRIAVRLGELAKEALLAADNAALERWVDGLHAAGESSAFTARMRAMARLGRGEIGDALRVLRRTRAQLDPKDHRRRCQTSLALGVALSVAGRPDEALLEGMDALARARETGDAQGAKACLAFLAKLYTSVERTAEAGRLLGG